MSLQHQTLFGHCEKDGCATSGLLPVNGRKKRRNASLIRAQMCYFFVFLYFWPNYPHSCPTTNPVEVISHWPRLSKTVAWTGRRRLPGFVIGPQHSVLLFFSSFLLRVEARSSPSQNVCSVFHCSFVSFFPPEAQTLNAVFFFVIVTVTVIAPSGRARACVCVSMHPIGLFGRLVPEKRTSVSLIRDEKTFVSTGSPLRFDVHFHRRRPRRMRFIYDPDEDK